VGRKQVFGSEARLAGKGCQTFALCVGVFCLFSLFNRVVNCLRSGFFSLVPNDLLDEKEAEKRATIYRPKTPLKRERKLHFCRVSAFFYASLLGAGIRLSLSNVVNLSI